MSVSKIVVLNPYLQRGHVESSEVEGCQRFVAAAKNMGIEAVILARSEEIADVDPDFVLALSYQEPKLTHYPTYGSLPVPLGWIQGVPRFLRNIFSYDGYLVLSPIIQAWLSQLCQQTNKTLHVTNAAFSVPKTPFKPLNFSQATAVYMGVNWDGLRHYDLFRHFEDNDYLKCFGPPKSWEGFPAHLYAGKVPFDGFSTLDTYAKYGAGLCMNHPAFDDTGTPSCRTFEIAAASAVVISARNAYMQLNYGDSVLYVDQNQDTKTLAESIKEHVRWIRAHPDKAQEMAKSANEIFNRQLSLEVFIERIIHMHHNVMRDYCFEKPTPIPKSIPKQPEVTYLIPVDSLATLDRVLDDLNKQTYESIRIVLLADQNRLELSSYLNDKVSMMHYTGPECNPQLINDLLAKGSEWFCVVKSDDRIFPNHTALLIQHYQNSQHDKNNEVSAIIFGNSLEHSQENNLKDKIQDPHMIYLNSKVRVGNLTPCTAIPLCAVFFKLDVVTTSAFIYVNLMDGLKVDYSTSLSPLDVAIHANGITCSTSVSHSEKAQVVVIQNAVSPLLFSQQNFATEGGLLT